MKRKISLTAMLMLSGFLVCAQSLEIGRKQVDSLKRELSTTKQDTNRVNIMIALGRQYSQVDPDSAILYLQPALDLSRKLKFIAGETRVLAQLAYCIGLKGNQPKALALTYQGLQLVEDNNLRAELMSLYNNLVNIYHNISDFPKSLEYSKKLLAIKESLQREDRVATERLRLGYLFRQLGQPDSTNHYSALGYNYTVKHLDQVSVENYSYIGAWQSDLGNDSLALYYYKMGVQKTSELDHRFLAVLYSNLSEFFRKQNLIDSAIYYAGLSLTEAGQISFKMMVSTSSKQLAELYEARDTKQSLFYYKMAAAAKDSLSGSQIIQGIETIANNEVERQQELEAAQKSYQSTLRQYALAAGAGVLLVIALLLYRNNRQKQKANKALEKILSELKSTQSQLIQSEKMASLGELTAGIAHEIQNPLNFVNNFSDVNKDLLLEMTDEIEKGHISEVKAIASTLISNEEKINHHGKRADAIVKGMLQHSRTSTGLKEPTDLNALADEYLRLAYHGMRAKDKSFRVTLTTDFDQNIGKVNIIPQDIGRVILNLISNAFYAVDEKRKQEPEGYQPTVSVTTKKNGDKILMTVQDNGNGIPEKFLDKIFQPFFTTKPTGQGTGLGLSLSYDIVKAHGGEIKATTEEGRGSEFIIELN